VRLADAHPAGRLAFFGELDGRRRRYVERAINEIVRFFHSDLSAGFAEVAMRAARLWAGEQSADEAQLKPLLVPYSSHGMVSWSLSPRVGNVKNNDPSLAEPINLP
jgi:hypothetical protein